MFRWKIWITAALPWTTLEVFWIPTPTKPSSTRHNMPRTCFPICKPMWIVSIRRECTSFPDHRISNLWKRFRSLWQVVWPFWSCYRFLVKNLIRQISFLHPSRKRFSWGLILACSIKVSRLRSIILIISRPTWNATSDSWRMLAIWVCSWSSSSCARVALGSCWTIPRWPTIAALRFPRHRHGFQCLKQVILCICCGLISITFQSDWLNHQSCISTIQAWLVRFWR